MHSIPDAEISREVKERREYQRLCVELENKILLEEAGDETTSSSLNTPHGRLSKSSVCHQMEKHKHGIGKMEFNRLRRITDNGLRTALKRKQEKEGPVVDYSSAEVSMKEIQPHDFVALAFNGSGHDSVWFLKILRMHVKSNRKTIEETKPVGLGTVKADNLWLSGTWFTPMKKENRYELGNAVTLADPSAHAMFPMSACLGHVDFGHDANDKLFYLNDPTQLERFMLDSANVQTKPGNNRTVAEVQADIDRRAENALSALGCRVETKCRDKKSAYLKPRAFIMCSTIASSLS